ncbi:heme exporter protein CcmD [Phenylobacterium sp.]|uniref:heme exporter protein CcmD n=1 Tax=Phenylobacterium sp. TaxID=1871053 RepID=UPI0035B2AC27
MLDLDAGKYALFVWPAFGVTAVVFAGMIIGSLAHARRWRKRAEDLDARRK